MSNEKNRNQETRRYTARAQETLRGLTPGEDVSNLLLRTCQATYVAQSTHDSLLAEDLKELAGVLERILDRAERTNMPAWLLEKHAMENEELRRVLGTVKRTAEVGAWLIAETPLSKETRQVLVELGYTVRHFAAQGGVDMVAVSWDVPSPVTPTALERFRGYSAHEMMSETTRVIMERMA